ncbi:MAG: DNA repair protein RecN [Burkholderiales bacterium]|nr:DNA repair protein RecN [Burkholderiales bacterium]
MLRRLALRDFVIVPTLELEFQAGFSVLTGETGAGKSILVDALQLVLGSRGDAGLVREGAAHAELSAEFDAPPSLADWLDEAGFAGTDDVLLLRRTIDAQGKSRAWINGSAATVAQLREVADHLLDIHGQHAWQSLTRAPAVRALLDGQAGVDTIELSTRFAARKAATEALERARERSEEIVRERERLAWQIGELDKLAPGDGEWDALSAEHQRLAHAQSLMDAARVALDAVADGEVNAEALTHRAVDALSDGLAHDARLRPMMDVLQGALAQLQDAAHSLRGYLGHAELDPDRLAELDARLSAWMGLARRHRRPPDELPALLAQWRTELQALDAATDVGALEKSLADADRHYVDEARRVSAARAKAAPPLATAVTQAMQSLGMAGGRFDVALLPEKQPQSFGLESVELLVAGHAGSTPRPLAKVASGGELSRLALAIAVTTVRAQGNVASPLSLTPSGGGRRRAASSGLVDSGAGTLIFDEIDAGIGGSVGDTVGSLMKQLGRDRHVLAVTHLAQVAACADQHYVVAKGQVDGAAASSVRTVAGEARVSEIARMLGGQQADTSLAHAQALLQHAGVSTIATPRRRTQA